MLDKKVYSNPHRRYNPLSGEWVLVSPHRTKRPWQGKKDKQIIKEKKEYDPECYLCPGNERAGGNINPKYKSTFVFNNDFSALLSESTTDVHNSNELLKIEGTQGECKVICFSPNHSVTLAEMSAPEIRKVIDMWVEQAEELATKYKWVQVFENKGEIMGCSNPHPHGQIWASSFIPNEALKEIDNQGTYFNKHKNQLLLDYMEEENIKAKRKVIENDFWIVLVPFWAIWPFETLLFPKFHIKRLQDLSTDERESLASILKRLLVKYDNLFNTSFPYTMGWHAAPNDGLEYSGWQLHAHFYPPLLRSAGIKKFMVGYEMLAEVQRDITPEEAAQKLSNQTEIHYLETL
ncbi:MAG: UDP-glucose--hexose-1-phosphate uridylyltransferase [Ignavibacterium sp.]|nr:MAG: UDP-glucose--hexose-1-phosphate uridylyltransferase [Ignavibacterium sp.]